jgi:hypothetical protein
VARVLGNIFHMPPETGNQTDKIIRNGQKKPFSPKWAVFFTWNCALMIKKKSVIHNSKDNDG